MAFYCWSFLSFLIFVGFNFCVLPWEKRGWYNYVTQCSAAMSDGLPIITVAVAGRKRIFGLVSRNFHNDPTRLTRDGAFMASMLDRVTVKKGDSWWVHHGAEDVTFPKGDPRRNWHWGIVVHVDEAGFDVQPSVEGGICSAPDDVCRVQQSGRGLSVEDMLQLARCELRCIEWTRLTKEIMTGAICGAAGVDVSNMYNLSRSLMPNETIDYFMSHSWHDDASSKWDCLTVVATEFRRRHRRFPTFWLDKVCIDQNRIGDGLRALPVNVMACRQVLVLCGDTYPDRLYCIWELYTLLCFTGEDDDDLFLRRLEFFPLGGEDRDVLERLMKFRTQNAHCYDPNEERRLKSIIRAGGEHKFDFKMQSVARDIATRKGVT